MLKISSVLATSVSVNTQGVLETTIDRFSLILTVQPLAANLYLLLSRTLVLLQPPLANINDILWCLDRLLREDVKNHDGILVNPIHDPPCATHIHDS